MPEIFEAHQMYADAMRGDLIGSHLVMVDYPFTRLKDGTVRTLSHDNKDLQQYFRFDRNLVTISNLQVKGKELAFEFYISSQVNPLRSRYVTIRFILATGSVFCWATEDEEAKFPLTTDLETDRGRTNQIWRLQREETDPEKRKNWVLLD